MVSRDSQWHELRAIEIVCEEGAIPAQKQSPHSIAVSMYTLSLPSSSRRIERREVRKALAEKNKSSNLAGRIQELDGIRGVAISMVLFRHFFLDTTQFRLGSPLAYAVVPFRLTWSGVDLFFVLSGFLIGGILLDARDASNYFRVFYTRRFFRIVPMYSITLICFCALSGLVKAGITRKLWWMTANPIPWYSYVLFAQNFWMASKNTLGTYGLGPTWSLAVEEQFYLTLPLLIRTLTQRSLSRVLIAGILAAPLLRIVLYVLWPKHFFAWLVLMPCRADALLLGVLGVVIWRNPRLRFLLESKRRTFEYVLALMATGIVFLTLRSPSQFSVVMLSVGYTWLAVSYIGFLLYALIFRSSVLSRFLCSSWLVWLGTIAYGTYLLHELVMANVFGLLWSRSPSILSLRDLYPSLVSLVLTLCICRYSWIYFEKPLVRFGHRLAYKPSATASAERIGNLADESRPV